MWLLLDLWDPHRSTDVETNGLPLSSFLFCYICFFILTLAASGLLPFHPLLHLRASLVSSHSHWYAQSSLTQNRPKQFPEFSGLFMSNMRQSSWIATLSSLSCSSHFPSLILPFFLSVCLSLRKQKRLRGRGRDKWFKGCETAPHQQLFSRQVNSPTKAPVTYCRDAFSLQWHARAFSLQNKNRRKRHRCSPTCQKPPPHTPDT